MGSFRADKASLYWLVKSVHCNLPEIGKQPLTFHICQVLRSDHRPRMLEVCVTHHLTTPPPPVHLFNSFIHTCVVSPCSLPSVFKCVLTPVFFLTLIIHSYYYIDSEGLSNANQSAYRRLYSTESALLKIQNDIAASMDSEKAVALTLLVLSVAFNTIDHDILFNSLRDWFGVGGTVFIWIKSYLSNHKQKVKLGNSFSDAFSLPYGVPQGSVLGLFLFTLYTTPLSNIISNFNVTHHLYADDTQTFLALDHRNSDSSFAELTECLTWVQNKMAGVKLKLNPKKTEFIIIGDRQARESLINKFPTQLLGNSISRTRYSQEPRCYF